jgi:hypothetical protein
MGTTLTGTTPQDTYDSLIKVTDNGPLTGSLKKLTDGLGNDSSLSLSTVAASVTGTLAVSSTLTAPIASVINTSTGFAINTTSSWTASAENNPILTFGRAGAAVAGSLGYDDLLLSLFLGTTTSHKLLLKTNNTTRLTVDTSGNVGITTSTPAAKLDIQEGGVRTFQAGLTAYKTYTKSAEFQFSSYQSAAGSPFTKTTDLVANADSGVASEMRVLVAASGSNPAEVVRFTPNGLTFNGDTAAANALDDYEEGTWTPNAFGDTTIGSTTYENQFGYYTKIGRQVNITLFLGWTVLTGTGAFRIGGLPFASGNLTQNFAVGSCNTSNFNWTGGSFVSALVIPNTSTIAIYGSTDDAGSVEQLCVDEQANVRITVTYYV